jgi:hypothetical protein
MNFKYRIDSMENEIKQAVVKLADMKKELKECVNFTGKFLKTCEELGIDKVAICVSHPSVKTSVGFTFGPANSVFASGEHDGWPAIWHATEKAGVSGGCGNHNQHSLNNVGMAKLIDGCYHLSNGKWKKVD